MSIPLFKATFKANWKLLLIFTSVMIFYSLTIMFMYDPVVIDSMEAMLKLLPQELIKAFGYQLQVPSYVGFLASYFYGFLAVGFPTIFIAIVGHRLIGKMVDNGSMAYLLATPNSRIKVVLTQAVVFVLMLALMVSGIIIAGIIFSEMRFPGELEMDKFLLVNLTLFFYLFAISSITFLASCLFNDGKNSVLLGTSLPVGFLIFQMLTAQGDKLEFFKYFTLLTLYQPNNIIVANYQPWPMFMLALIGFVLYGLSFLIFKRRNLPI
jgi:ABC-2 type transport system permease protein